VSPQLDARLLRLKEELDDHARIARFLGLDFERPIRSLGDGYPENAVTWVGKFTEKLLKRLWRHHHVPGSPAGKSLGELIDGCRPHLRSHHVIEALRDIARLRNRAAHDGYVIADEDGLTAVRRLIDVLAWYTSTGSEALSGDVPRLAPAVAARAEFLAGLYVTLDFKLAKRFELSNHTVYQLFVRERGLRTEYVELLLSRDTDDVAKVLEATGGELLQTTLPKLTRFLILEGDRAGPIPEQLLLDYRVVSYDNFMGTLVDVDRHVAAAAGAYPGLAAATLPVSGDLLAADERSGELTVREAGTAAVLLDSVAARGGNLLIVGRPGTGKTTLLKYLVAGAAQASTRRYRFFFDLSVKDRGETFAEFVTRTLAPYMSVETAYVFPAFCYFARAGSVLCALDGFDEAVPEITQAGFLELFTELADVLSAESAVVMTSRVSFLEDSPQVRRLLDGTSLMSERLVQELHAQGVDPLRVPRFSVLKLRDGEGGRSLLAARLETELAPGGRDGAAGRADLADLLGRHIAQVVEPSLLPRVVEFFGLALLRGAATFSLAELVNELGISVFEGERIGFGQFRLAGLFRVADGAGGKVVAFRHAAYQELLVAEYLRTAAGREMALSVVKRPRLTEQVREFLHRLSARAGPGAGSGDCVLPAGVYLVGPSHHLMLRRIDQAVRFDRFPVTVSRYNQFLADVARAGSARWDHPDTPAGHSHEPWRQRLRVPDYYDNPAYESYPAIAINWWSAYAFARWDGKRLPTSLEWEAAARGADGRLFPWGDDIDLEAVNCADSWAERPLITYEAWREELSRGRLKDALPGPVDAHAANVSPFGVREMAGNVWEFTGTVFGDLNEAVICGGSFDNPYRAVQASSKGSYRRRGASNAVGFRCVEELG
jgi:Sulfatase-modifying factor enzyme 1/NACHT domain